MSIHTPLDGQGFRRVYLNGMEVPRCTYADTELGIIRFFDNPPQIDPETRAVIEHEARGIVRVEFI